MKGEIEKKNVSILLYKLNDIAGIWELGSIEVVSMWDPGEREFAYKKS